MAALKKRLGRGLDNLIAGGGQAAAGASAPANATQAAAARAAVHEADGQASDFREIPVNRVRANPYQPRRHFAPEKITELADSIRAEGLLQPIVVRSRGEDFELIAGERRWRACQELKLKTIPARVLEASDASAAVLSLIENLQRADLDPVEEALGYASLMRDFNLRQEDVADRVGKGRATIANSLRLLHLDKEIQGYLAKGMLSVGHAKLLLGFESSEERLLLARTVIEQGLSVRATEQLMQKRKHARRRTSSEEGDSSRQSAAEASAVASVERQLASQLKAPVQIKHTPKRGRIVIEYYGNDDLQRILELLGSE